jgi:cytochrome oxidase Cu insertion factor (SCO1/SenC/PrrC family)
VRQDRPPGQRLAALPSHAALAQVHGRMTAVDGSNLTARIRLPMRMRMRTPFWIGLMTGLLAVAACGTSVTGTANPAAQAASRQARAAAANPDLDPGTSLGGDPAPGFRLVNQFGQPTSLSQFRGKVVILAFTDSQCTTVCPLTTASMLEARALLGAAGDQVQLLGIDANPKATAVHDVMAYSRAHGMVNQWDFLTGSPAQLAATWQAYHIYARIQTGQVDHTPALYLIDQRGRERKIYLTTMAYASIGQAAQILAAEAASLLPGHPKLASQRSLAHIGGIGPTVPATLDTVPSGSITLGPGRPHLVLFFATWLTQTSGLRAHLTVLNRYAQAARRGKVPQLVAVDEAATEPSPGAARARLRHLGQPLSYPIALDTTGRLADGYGAQDQPWFVLTSASGKIVWKHDGWLSLAALEAAARGVRPAAAAG